MKRLTMVFCAGLAFAVAPAHAQRMSKLSGGKLVSVCANARTKEVCEAYVSGVTDGIAGIEHQMTPDQGHAVAGSICVPNATTTDALRSTIVDYIRSHGDMANKPAAVPAYEALHAAYPCKS